MNQLLKYTTILIFTAIIASCGNNSQAKKENTSDIDETAFLFDFIEKSGDVINSEDAPFTIGADEVFEELPNTLVLDIRDTASYYSGHIDGAVRVEAQELPAFLEEKVNVSKYNKVVIACFSGQSAAYYVALLRLIGYSNVYTLRYGMAGWNRKIIPNKILDNLSDKYAGILETKINTPDKKYDFPKLTTTQNGGCSIMKSRVKTLFEEGFGKAHIKIDSVVKHLDQYFIVNYWQPEDYNKGHLPGSFQFTPRKSIKKNVMLSYLPTDKPIAIYCSSGQFSASIVAFLRVLGYNATSISFGTNGFMHSKMLANQIKAFDPSENIANYPLVEGTNPSSYTVPAGNANQEVKVEKVPSALPIKKKQKTGGGGC